MTPRKISAALALSLALLAVNASAQVSISVNIGPPPLPVYEQPAVPGDGYIWTPGYWSWDQYEQAYYWVPGSWVLAPFQGGLWTPGYWFYSGSDYRWRPGYWGRQVGFYGGINYGHGYYGNGYDGGRWNQGVFNYNRRVTHVDPRVIHHVYDARVSQARQPNGVSFNGGRGGVTARPPSHERPGQRQGPTPVQIQHEQAAAKNSGRERFQNARRSANVGQSPEPVNSPRERHDAGQQQARRIGQPAATSQIQGQGEAPTAVRPVTPQAQPRQASRQPHAERHDARPIQQQEAPRQRQDRGTEVRREQVQPQAQAPQRQPMPPAGRWAPPAAPVQQAPQPAAIRQEAPQRQEQRGGGGGDGRQHDRGH